MVPSMRTNDAIRHTVNRELLAAAEQRKLRQTSGTRSRVLDLLSQAERVRRNLGSTRTPRIDAAPRGNA